jgi:hypothetical protein
MTKRALTALKASIKHWEENVKVAKQGGRVDISPASCECCNKFNKNSNYDYESDCSGCPISGFTHEQYCTNTPYEDLYDILMYNVNGDLVCACESELAFLKSLLPKGDK